MNNLLEKKILTASIIRVNDIQGDKRTLQNKIQCLIRDRKILKIKNGLYAMINPLYNDIYANKFELATCLYKDACVVYHTALEYYGLSNQIYNLIQVATQKKERKLNFNGYTFEFYNNINLNYVKEIYQDSLIRVTSLEKTIVDCLNKPRLAGGIEEISIAISGIVFLDERKLLEILNMYDDKKLYKKVAYIINRMNKNIVSKDFYDICKEKMSRQTVDIRENRKLPYYIDKEWNVKVQKYLINEEN